LSIFYLKTVLEMVTRTGAKFIIKTSLRILFRWLILPSVQQWQYAESPEEGVRLCAVGVAFLSSSREANPKI
jgi:hypothetical protein